MSAPGREPLVAVRSAVPADEESLVAHALASAEESERYRGEMMHVGADVGALEELSLVAVIAGEVVGSLLARRTSPQEWMVTSIYTVPEARGVGVADAMMDRFRAHASAAGATRLLSRALPGDRETKNLFERHGFTARMLVLGTDLVTQAHPEPEA